MNGTSVPFANAQVVERLLDYPSLIEAIRSAFLQPPTTPQRLSIPIEETEEQPGGTVLVMPSWRSGGLLGVKIISIYPNLSNRPGGATRATYVALDASTGELRGLIDGHALTLRRTAATSLLAAQVMARPDPDTVLVVGTGSLAQTLAFAYAAVFQPRELMIWGRHEAKAETLADRIISGGVAARAITDLPKALGSADIVTVATLAQAPVLAGRYVGPGTHVDLVGGFNRKMREADDDLISKSRIVADFDTTALEAGDLTQPLDRGLIRKDDVATLGSILSGERTARESPSCITLFKSAGHASEDLAAAELLFRRWSL